MGTWGLGPFENDGASEPLSDLERGDVESVKRCLSAALDEADYLEVDAGQAALAASEFVAGAHGRPAADLPRRATDVLAAQGDAVCGLGVVGLARAAVARVVAEQSELAELWDEGEAGPSWRQAVADLQQRLLACPT